MNNEPFTIRRTIGGLEQEITLAPKELDAIYRFVETENVKGDIVSRCNDRRDQDTLPTVFIPSSIEQEYELLEYAYNYFRKIHDCNIDYNSTIDAVIDNTAEWYQSQKQTKLQGQILRIMENPALCEQFAECLYDSINTDEEPMGKIGFYLCKSYLEGDIDQLLSSICGWSIASLLNRI